MGLMVGLSLAQTGMNIYAQNKGLEAQAQANVQTARNMVKSMNFSFQNLEQERRDSFEATVQELEKVQLQGRRMESSVNAAINEGLAGGGRTAHLLSRAAQADTDRALSSTRDNYSKKSNEIDLNKEATLLNTKTQISSIPQVKKPYLFGTLLQFGAAFLQGGQQQEQLDGMRHSAGITSGTAPPSVQTGGLSGGYNMMTGAYTPYRFDTVLDWQNKAFDFSGYRNPFSQTTQMINIFG